MSRWLGVGLFIAASSAHAYYLTPSESCTPIDLRQEQSLLIRNQGEVSWCYAHSTADYLQFYFRLPTQISAADIAIQYNQRKWPRLLRWLRRAPVAETGFVRSAMWDALELGYCPEALFPSDFWLKRHQGGAQAGKTELVPLDQAFAELRALRKQVASGKFKSSAELPFVYEFNGIEPARFLEILRDASELSIPADFRDAVCEGKRVKYPGEIDAIGMRFKGRNTFTRINSVLETKTPVSVDYFYGVLENRDRFRRAIDELHSTLLMGRKFDAAEGECKYLIKNSYGTDCSAYDPRNECQGGYLWVTESSLYRAMVSYVYIKDPLMDDTGPDLTNPVESKSGVNE